MSNFNGVNFIGKLWPLKTEVNNRHADILELEEYSYDTITFYYNVYSKMRKKTFKVF